MRVIDIFACLLACLFASLFVCLFVLLFLVVIVYVFSVFPNVHRNIFNTVRGLGAPLRMMVWLMRDNNASRATIYHIGCLGESLFELDLYIFEWSLTTRSI